MSRFWVAGATGFLGQAIVRELRAQSHEVVGASFGGGQVDDVPVSAVDVLDERAVAEAARGCDGAFYAVGKVSRSDDDGELLHRLHVRGTRSAMAGLRSAGVRRVVYASTSGTIAVSEDAGTVADEQSVLPHALISRWPYYRTKRYGEQEALNAAQEGAFDVVVVNPSLLLGPGDTRASSTLDVRRIIAGSAPATLGGGIAFVDVRDAATGMVQAFDRGRSGERYLLSGANMPVSVFVGRVCRLAGVAAPRFQMPKKPALALAGHWAFSRLAESLGGASEIEASSVDIGSHFWYCSSAKAAAELGFTSRSPSDTLRDTVRDIAAGP